MLLKSKLDKSGPQVGVLVSPNNFNPFNLFSSIHSGSFFVLEIKRTISSFIPGFAIKRDVCSSASSYNALLTEISFFMLFFLFGCVYGNLLLVVHSLLEREILVCEFRKYSLKYE